MKPMKKKLKIKSTSGITLIALIITIIVLLILAGVGISMLMEENGILNKATTAKEETIKAQLKEELELAIIEIQADELERGNTLTLEKLKDELPLANSLKDNIDNVDIQNDIITGVYKGYNFEIDSKYKVTIGTKYNGILFSYTLNPEGYTNGNITLTVTLKGEAEVEGLEGLTKNDDGTYTITENGEYEFKIKDSEGTIIDTKKININRIDREKPTISSIEIDESTITKNGFTITVNATDNEGRKWNRKI